MRPLAARRALAVLILGVSVLAVMSERARGGGTGGEGARPNIVLFLADDLGWRDTAAYGSRFYRTPHIDRLAARGRLFTDAYAASPLCSPTRASLLTGQYPARLRLTTPAGHLPQEVLDPKVPTRGPPDQKAVTPETRTRLPNDTTTIAELLRGAGYRTAFFGKWHLGRAPYLPEAQGFERVVGGRHHPGPPGGYFSPWPIDTIPQDGAGEHITDRLAKEATGYLRRHARERRDEPFFLCFWDYSVHAPYQAKPELVAGARERVDGDDAQRNPVMAAMISPLDDAVGELLDTLDELGLTESTLFVFTSDNGGNMYDVVEGLPPTSNAPLRGGKGTIHEGGVRVPLIVSWPSRIAAGTRSSAVISSVDWLPTFAAAAGVEVPATTPVDGVDMTAALVDDAAVEREAIFCHFPHYVRATGNLPATSVRAGEWKLVRYWCDGPEGGDRLELYDLAGDLGETRDLAAARPEKARDLDELISRHLRETRALVPAPNPAYRAEQLGWTASRDVELSRGAEGLVLESRGGDPFVEVRDVPSVAGSLVVTIRLRSSSRGGGRVYWSAKGDRGFALARSVEFQPSHDGRWHDHRVELECAHRLTGLRVDPATAPGRIEIASVILSRSGGEVLESWRFAAADPAATGSP